MWGWRPSPQPPLNAHPFKKPFLATAPFGMRFFLLAQESQIAFRTDGLHAFADLHKTQPIWQLLQSIATTNRFDFSNGFCTRYNSTPDIFSRKQVFDSYYPAKRFAHPISICTHRRLGLPPLGIVPHPESIPSFRAIALKMPANKSEIHI